MCENGHVKSGVCDSVCGGVKMDVLVGGREFAGCVYPTSQYQIVFGMCGIFGVWDALQRICAMQQFYVCDAVVVVLIDGNRVSAATEC